MIFFPVSQPLSNTWQCLQFYQVATTGEEKMLLAFCGWGQEVHAAVPKATPWQQTVCLHMLGVPSLAVILMASGASTVYKSYFNYNIDLRLLDGPLFIYIYYLTLE